MVSYWFASYCLIDATMEKKSWGGSRKGSGRKRKDDADKQRTKTIRISENAAYMIDGMKNKCSFVSGLIMDYFSSKS